MNQQLTERPDSATAHTPSRRGSRRLTNLVASGAVFAFAFGLAGSVSATQTSGTRDIFVPIPTCRLLDTRAGSDNVGTRSTPVGTGETFTTQVTGSNGQCVIPSDAAGVTLNVTIVNPTVGSYLSVRPADAPPATSSNLNWVAGQAPTPNAVTTKLSADGKVAIFNHVGSVDVIVDIVGYYVDHNFDDRYYTKAQTYSNTETYSKAETDSRIAAGGLKPPTEVVVSAGVGQPVPATLAVTSDYSTLDETITTSTTGHWLVRKVALVRALQCGGDHSAWYYIVVDNTVIRASAVLVPSAALPDTANLDLYGATAASFNANSYTVKVSAQCADGNPGTVAAPSSATPYARSPVVVLG